MADISLLDEQDLNNVSSWSYHAKAPTTSGFIKIVATGELNAQGQDRRLLVRLNGRTDGYQSFVHMGGHAGLGEWDNTGFYMGRNGWGLDATFMMECLIAIAPAAQKITGAGLSTFGNGNNTILGYRCNGFLSSNPSVSSIDVVVTGGVVRGISRIFSW